MVSSRALDRKLGKFLKGSYTIECEAIPKLIVSLTSYPARLDSIKYTLYSLFQQSVKPSKIVLCLAKEEIPDGYDSIPEILKKFEKLGLEILFTDSNYRSYNKLVHTLQLYPESIIVTADDDLYYNSQWLEKLYTTHEQHPEDIIAHRVHAISFTNKKIDPYNSWNGPWVECSYLNFLTGVGGVLYPPNSLYKDVSNYHLFQELSPLADDVWFYIMALLNRTKIRRIRNEVRQYCYIDKLNNSSGLMDLNVGENRNDYQINDVLSYYGLYDNFYELFYDIEESYK